MCGRTLIFLQIITCGFSYGMESQTIYEYPHNNQKDSVQRNLNLELSKITHQIQIGHDIELYCGTTDSELHSQSLTFWHFKACGHGLNKFSCSKAIETRDTRTWQKLKCSNNNNCGSSLTITNPTEKDSGLYRCTSIYPFKASVEKPIVKAYFLDVRNTTIPSPVIVDGPKNTTTSIDSQVVLQCCVNSLIRPSITWFKRQDGPTISSNGTTNRIEYLDIHGVSHIYVQVESAGERLLSDGVYLSKLILNGITEHDAGSYACVAINYGGYKIQEAHLNVLDALDDDNHELGTRSLLLLFLIPVGLASAPLTLWICYVLLRQHGINQDHKIDKNGNDYVQVDRIVVS